MNPPAKQTSSIRLPARNSTSTHPEEHGKHGSIPPPCILPRWPRYAAMALHTIVISSSIAIIALVAHSLRTYFDTRNIKFGGLNASWPTDLNLRPEYFYLVVASLSLAVSLPSSLYSLMRRNSPTFSVIEVASVIAAMALVILWITGVALQYQSGKSPKRDVLLWSCRRSESPTNTLVGYASTCIQQEAIKYLAVLITVVELLLLACLFGTYRITRTISRKLEESFT